LVSGEHGDAAPSAEALAAALAGVEQALPAVTPGRRTQLLDAVAALTARSPAKVGGLLSGLPTSRRCDSW
jgi:hypothetical protein